MKNRWNKQTVSRGKKYGGIHRGAMLERSIQETSIRKKKKNKFDAFYKIESELSYKKANFF